MTLAESLRAAKERNATLSDADTRIAETITALEEALRAHINIRIRIPIDDQRFLAFGKIGGAWRLLVEGAKEQQALASSPRDVRTMVLADGLVEKLIRDAAAQLDKQIEERRRALDAASTIFNALNKVGAP